MQMQVSYQVRLNDGSDDLSFAADPAFERVNGMIHFTSRGALQYLIPERSVLWIRVHRDAGPPPAA